MVDQELQDKVRVRLEDFYGANRVVAQPKLPGETSVYPDFGVFRNSDQTEPFFLVECSSFRTAHRRKRDFEEIVNAVSETPAPYGALIGSDVEFVFSITDSAYRTYGDFPTQENKDPVRRQIQSGQECESLLERTIAARQDLKGTERHDEAGEEILYSLQLVLEERHADISSPDTLTERQIKDLQHQVEERHEAYTIEGTLQPTIVKVVKQIFSGYTVRKTPDENLHPLFNIVTDSQLGDEYSTPVSIASEIVRLAQPKKGEIVLDPAAGHSTLLTHATAKGASGIGIEINPAVASLATAFVDIFDRDIEIRVGNFFVEEIVSNLSETVETVVVDPPFGARIQDKSIPYFDRDRPVSSECAFLAKSLSLLPDGGSITIAVPASFLHKERSKWLRRTIQDKFRIDSIIQVIDGPLYRSTSIDVAFLTVTKTSVESDHPVQYSLIEKPDYPDKALTEAVTEIVSGTAPTIPQKELNETFNVKLLTEERRILEQLNQQFDIITRLGEVAEIHVGNQPKELLKEAGDDTYQYLRIRDVSDGTTSNSIEYLPKQQAKIIADDHCLLLAALGEKLTTHIPSDSVAPARHWIVLEFNSYEEALVYEAFFQSSYGEEQLEAMRSGTNIPRLNVRDVRELHVPNFDDTTLSKRAQSIKEHQEEIADLEQERKQLRQQREHLTENLDDLLRGGESDE